VNIGAIAPRLDARLALSWPGALSLDLWDESTGRCRFCGYLYYTWKLPMHETICSMRPRPAEASGPPLPLLPDEHALGAPRIAQLTPAHGAVV
jgi:hypothetical protein